jgi:hypothetical protein
MAGTTITGTTHTSITLTSLTSNPIFVTSTAKITPTSANMGALYGDPGNDWTITNAGLINDGTHGSGIQLGGFAAYANSAIITNQTGGTISGGAYGIRVYNNSTSTITNQTGADITATAVIGSAASAVYMSHNGTVSNFGIINAPTSATNARGVILTSGGTVINNSTGTIIGGTGVFLQGIGTVINAGTIEAGSTTGTAVEFFISGTNKLIVDPKAEFYGGVAGGSGTLALASVSSSGTVVAGTLTATNFSGFNAIDFDPGSQWTLVGSSAALSGVISGFTTHDTIDLTGFFATAASYSSITHNLTLTNSVQASETLHFTGGPFHTTGSVAVTTNAAGTVLTDQVCFVAGARVATPSGEVPVEQLAVGDMVLTQRGAAKPITWIGHGRVLAARGRRSAATPVIVRRGALADNVPHCDLHLTKGHSLYFDGALIPVEFLVNHRSIVWDDQAQEVEVYHIELASHDVLIANGAPAESYRDDGNRWLFQNANSDWDLPGMPPYAPILTGGALVDATWRRLLDRAGPRPGLPTTDEPDLHLLVDDQRIDGRALGNGRHVFRLPKQHGSVRIASRAGAPDEFAMARDPRQLGVALRQAVLWQGRQVKTMEADDEALVEGFHAFEVGERMRWTDGNARLPASLFDGFDGACELELHVVCIARYALGEGRQGIAA